MQHFRELAGEIAGGFFFLAFFPYFIDILRHRTKPNKATWLIWTILGVLILLSYKSVGAHNTLPVAIAGAIGPFAILILSVWYGEGGTSKLDIAGLIGSAIGIGAWWLTTDPFVGLVLFLATDWIAAFLTIVKTWKDPKSESLLAWVLWFTSSLFQFAALTSWNIHFSIYPLSFLIGQSIQVLLILRRYQTKAV